MWLALRSVFSLQTCGSGSFAIEGITTALRRCLHQERLLALAVGCGCSDKDKWQVTSRLDTPPHLVA